MARNKKCDGVIPERVVVDVDDGGMEVGKHTEPEHPCDRPATMLSRSIKSVQLEGFHGYSWRITSEAQYCEQCFVPGRVVHHDGMVTNHAAMALE